MPKVALTAPWQIDRRRDRHSAYTPRFTRLHKHLPSQGRAQIWEVSANPPRICCMHAICNTWAQQTAIKESLMSLNRKVLMDVRGLSAKVGHTYIIGKHRICRIFRTCAFDCPVKEIHCHQSLYQGYKDLSICGGSLL